jgi:hypothetical protein
MVATNWYSVGSSIDYYPFFRPAARDAEGGNLAVHDLFRDFVFGYVAVMARLELCF